MSDKCVALLLVLTQEGAIPRLLRAGQLSTDELVDGEICVVDFSRRNLNLAVISKTGTSVFLKQGKRQDRFSTVQSEARFFDWLDAGTCGTRIRALLPARYFYDDGDDVLALEFFNEAVSLMGYQTTGRRRFPLWPARRIAAFLARLHRLPAPQGLRADPPWVLALTQPRLEMYSQICAANLELLVMLQQYPVFEESFGQLRNEWRRSAPIHGDLKWDNCLVLAKTPGRRRELRLIDWETFQSGDPLWDVASLLSEHLRFWLNSIPVVGEEPTEHVLNAARFPLESLQPSMSAFWEEYVRRSRWNNDQESAARAIVTRYVAAVLIQFSYEQLQGRPHVNANTICFLQLAQNILERPVEAAVHILSLRAPDRVLG